MTQIVELTPTVTTQGFVYSGKIGGASFSYTVGPAATVQIIVEALAPIIDALADVTATEDNTKITVTSTAGVILEYTELVPELRVKDATLGAGIAADLAAIFAQDEDWFGLLLGSNSEAEVNAAAAWIEDKRRMLVYTTADFGTKDAGTTTDLMSDLKGLNYFNTGGWHHQDVNGGMAAAIMGQRLTALPGSDTWALKDVIGVPPTKLSAAEEAAVYGKNGNTYTLIKNLGTTFPGKIAGGDYFDIVRYIHFLHARLEELVFAVLRSGQKVEYTQAGIDAIVGAIRALLGQHAQRPINALDPTSIFVQAPKESEISQADKANRSLPNVEFGGKVKGAIHAVDIFGELTN
jgi:hypothetical protein